MADRMARFEHIRFVSIAANCEQTYTPGPVGL